MVGAISVPAFSTVTPRPARTRAAISGRPWRWARAMAVRSPSAPIRRAHRRPVTGPVDAEEGFGRAVWHGGAPGSARADDAPIRCPAGLRLRLLPAICVDACAACGQCRDAPVRAPVRASRPLARPRRQWRHCRGATPSSASSGEVGRLYRSAFAAFSPSRAGRVSRRAGAARSAPPSKCGRRFSANAARPSA